MKKISLTDNSPAFFFHSFYSVCTFVRACFSPGRHVRSRQIVCLFMYGLNHASIKMPSVILTEHTQSRQEGLDHVALAFPSASSEVCGKLVLGYFKTVKNVLIRSCLDKRENKIDVQLCTLNPRKYT